jgi:type VI secretion system secreted protein Hcp
MAAVDYYLKIDGIDGESSDSKHKGEIEIDSFSWGVTNGASVTGTGGLSAGRAQVQDIHFTAKVSKASPKLKLACASGQHLKKAVLVCRKAGKDQQEFLKYVFSDVLVSSYQIGGSGHGDVLPMDQFSLAFAKVEQEYKEQKADGTLGAATKAGWHVAEVKPV